MIPSGFRGTRKGTSSPRTGGGDPRGVVMTEKDNKVVPAQAGVIPKAKKLQKGDFSSPRTGGGDPKDFKIAMKRLL